MGGWVQGCCRLLVVVQLAPRQTASGAPPLGPSHQRGRRRGRREGEEGRKKERKKSVELSTSRAMPPHAAIPQRSWVHSFLTAVRAAAWHRSILTTTWLPLQWRAECAHLYSFLQLIPHQPPKCTPPLKKKKKKKERERRRERERQQLAPSSIEGRRPPPVASRSNVDCLRSGPPPTRMPPVE